MCNFKLALRAIVVNGPHDFFQNLPLPKALSRLTGLFFCAFLSNRSGNAGGFYMTRKSRSLLAFAVLFLLFLFSHSQAMSNLEADKAAGIWVPIKMLAFSASFWFMAKYFWEPTG
jgi:hypothetical protein